MPKIDQKPVIGIIGGSGIYEIERERNLRTQGEREREGHVVFSALVMTCTYKALGADRALRRSPLARGESVKC